MDSGVVLQMIAGGFTLFAGGGTLTWRIMSSKNNKDHNHDKTGFIYREECERVHKGVDTKMSEITTDVKDIQKKVGSIEGTVEATVKSVDGIRTSITDIHKKIDMILISKQVN